MDRVEPWRIAAQKAIELNPRLAEAHVLMGDSYYATPAWAGREGDALPTADEALEVLPGNVNIQ
jgi:hypothetical protein